MNTLARTGRDHADDATGPCFAQVDPDARWLLDSFALPCALVDRERDRLLACNSHFLATFDVTAAVTAWSQFMAEFEAFGDAGAESAGRLRAGDADEVQELYAPTTGESYAFVWSRRNGRDEALLSVINLTEMQQMLRRHSVLHEQLLSTSRTLSVAEIVNTLAHELNQPLGAASSYLEMAGRATARGDGERAQASIERSRAQVDHITGVLRRIREFVRTREPQREPRDMAELCHNALDMLRPEAARQRVRVQFDADDDLPPVAVDAVMIEQVLVNLGKNAIESMGTVPPAQRRLELSVRRDAEGRVRTSVTDNGPGLSIEEAQHLFTPLYTTKARGMGIGLAISRSIVEFHHGTLFVEPGRERGASFSFTLAPAE